MPASSHHETAEHPVEGFRSVVLPAAANRPLRVYLPTDYQPKYAYPLVVLFHADGECEEHATRLVPLLSRRNYVALCIRGGVKRGLRADGRPAFGWDTSAKGTDRGVKDAVRFATSSYSIHPDRMFFLGVGEGASAAYCAAEALGAAGVVSLNGVLPTTRRSKTDLRVLIAHGSANPVVPLADARCAATRLTVAGASVRLARFATSGRVHVDMLRDANRWIMAQFAK